MDLVSGLLLLLLLAFLLRDVTDDCTSALRRCYLRAVGRQVLWSAACVCLSVCVCVCVCVRTVFVRKISQERVHGSPPNSVGGSRG